MKLYKLNYLAPSSLKTKKVQQLSLEIESLIQEQGGILTQERKKEKINLGQPIEEKKDALLFTLKFQIDPKAVNSIREKVEEMPDVLRVMLEKAKTRKTRKKRKSFKKKTTPTKKEESKAKVELKKIEEKLDQILDEED